MGRQHAALSGLGYPLVPGYETVGAVRHAAAGASVQVGDWVFVPGSYSFAGVRNIFGGAGSRLVVPHERVVRVAPQLGPKAVLLALAATAYHALALREPMVAPGLIVGHGVMGRLLARIAVALGMPAPTVWETQPLRRGGAEGYAVMHPDEDARKDYASIIDVSGDSMILNTLIGRLAPGGEVVLAGFYKQDLGFAFAPAFMREAQIRIAAQWKKPDLQAVAEEAHATSRRPRPRGLRHRLRRPAVSEDDDRLARLTNQTQGCGRASASNTRCTAGRSSMRCRKGAMWAWSRAGW